LSRELSTSRRLTVVAVLHNVALAATHFARIAALDQGEIVADGRGVDVVTTSLLARVFGVQAVVHWHEGGAAIVPDVGSSDVRRPAS
jgi:iron complex transport system ATP-binding protein